MELSAGSVSLFKASQSVLFFDSFINMCEDSDQDDEWHTVARWKFL